MQHIVNPQGLNMPKLGLGTWPMLGEECTRAVEQALALGYRHIDTAAAYKNEDAVGQALAVTTRTMTAALPGLTHFSHTTFPTAVIHGYGDTRPINP